MFLIENLRAVLLWFLATLVAVDLTFLYFVLYRRYTRSRYYLAQDAARERFTPTIDAFVDQGLSLEEATAVLLAGDTEAEQAAIQERVLARVNPHNVERVTHLLFATGFVQRWTNLVFGKRRGAVLLESALRKGKTAPAGRREPRPVALVRGLRIFSVPRALALARLGKLEPTFVHPMLAESLLDPSPDVRRVAVTSMGRAGSQEALPLLFDELRRATAGGNAVSLRTAKAALSGYSLAQVSDFLPLLQDANARVRYFALNSAVEICARTAAGGAILVKNDFSRQFYERVRELSSDASTDGRAQSAALLQYFGDAGAVEELRRLLGDENEFVRLHAVRSATRFVELAPELVRCLSDARWRVREAAVRALAAFGPDGTDKLYRHFVSTSDSYSCEQIADEIQRGGVIRDLVAALAGSGDERELAVSACRKLVAMGKTALLTTALATAQVAEIRIPLMHALMEAPTDEVLTVMDTLATTEPGVVGETARTLMRRAIAGAGATGGVA